MSDQAVMTEHFIRHGNNYLTHVMMVDDPVYLTEPLVESQNFVLVSNVTPATYQTWTVCIAQEEIAGREKGYVPHYLPGQNPVLTGILDQISPPVRGAACGSGGDVSGIPVEAEAAAAGDAPRHGTGEVIGRTLERMLENPRLTL